MKKTLLLSGVLLALSASMALAAGGVNFGWGDCYPNAPLTNKSFACNSNTLSGAIMVGSYADGIDIPDWVGIEVVVDLQASSASLPDWWQFFNAGACRQNNLAVSGDFTSGPFTCADAFQGQAQGGISAYQTSNTTPAVPSGLPNAARLKIALAISSPQDQPPGVETYAFKATLSGQKSTGTGSCAGCSVPVSIVLNEVKSAGLTASERLTGAMGNQCLTWQGGGSLCGATPTHNSTWGQVKSLYR